MGSVTININGLTLVHKASGGVAISSAPDVCQTPPVPVPVPYTNIAFSSTLADGTTTVKVDGGNMAAINGSEFASSIGDEAGAVGGVCSGVHLQEATWITHSPNVKIEGQNACRLTDKMFMNLQNTVCVGELQKPGVQSGSDRREKTSLQIEDASVDQIKDITSSHETAKEMIQDSINKLERAKKNPDPDVNEYFGINDTKEDDIKKIDQIIEKYNKMSQGMGSIGYEVEHEEITPGEPMTVAYVYRLPIIGSVGDVHINYPAFGKLSSTDRAGTIVHEVSHYFAGTKDHAYEWEDKWDRLSQEQRMNNADSYSEFSINAYSQH